MPKTRKVQFSFDDRSLESLDKLVAQDRAPYMLGCSRPCCMPHYDGYRKVEVRNPETGETRVIVIPRLSNSSLPPPRG